MAGRESLVPLVLLTYGSVGRGDLVLGNAGLISVGLCAQLGASTQGYSVRPWVMYWRTGLCK